MRKKNKNNYVGTNYQGFILFKQFENYSVDLQYLAPGRAPQDLASSLGEPYYLLTYR